MNDRRKFLQTMSLLPLAPGILYDSFRNGNLEMPLPESEISLPLIGKVRVKKPLDFSHSPFGIGCETLDRDLWNPDEIYPWMDHLPVKWARLQTGWARVEKIKGTYDWGWLDKSVDGLVQRGFTPFFNVGYGNPNYTEGDTGYYPLINEDAFNAWKGFVKALTLRYKDRIKHYEIWNEPNLKGFWIPGEVDPAKYIKLVRETAQIIRKNCKGAMIIGGVLSRLPETFIHALFEKGLADEIDIFSFHPYGTLPEAFIDQIKALRKYIDRYNPRIKLWQGECGYPSQEGSTGYRGVPPWSEPVQAKIMLRRLLTDISHGVDMSLWFLIVDIHNYPKGTDGVNYKGILKVKPEVSPKLAFSALQNLGSLVYGNVKVANAVICCSASGFSDADELLGLFSNGALKGDQDIIRVMLNTAGGKVLAYWNTVRASDRCVPDERILLVSDWEGNGFQDPVLVDLLSGNIYELAGAMASGKGKDPWRTGYQAQLFRQLPVRDYPLLITDRKTALG